MAKQGRPVKKRQRGTDTRGGDNPTAVDIQVLVDVFSNMQLGLAVWRLEHTPRDVTFRLLASNPAAREVGRMPPGSLIGATLAEALPGSVKTNFTAILSEVVRSGEGRDLGVIHYGDENLPTADYRLKVFPIANDCVGTMFEVVGRSKPAGGAAAEQAEYRLTKRERTILYYVAAGRANKQIATALGISPETIHKHVSSILRKMGARSRTEATVLALNSGLLAP